MEKSHFNGTKLPIKRLFLDLNEVSDSSEDEITESHVLELPPVHIDDETIEINLEKSTRLILPKKYLDYLSRNQTNKRLKTTDTEQPLNLKKHNNVNDKKAKSLNLKKTLPFSFTESIAEKVKRRRDEEKEDEIMEVDLEKVQKRNLVSKHKHEASKELVNKRNLQSDKQVPNYFDRGMENGIPLRNLENFIFKDKEGELTSLEQLNVKQLSGTGRVLAPSQKTNRQPDALEIRFIVDEWAIDFSDNEIWLKTDFAWYKLCNPHPSFKSSFKSMQKKGQNLYRNQQTP